jgi:hypothetical protein
LVIEGFQATPDQIEDAIVMQDTQPRRQQLTQWYEQGQLAAAEVQQEESAAQDNQPSWDLPPLDSYREGDEVWGYFPHSEAKWLKATVTVVAQGFLRIKSGFLGMLIERPEMIAPGDWLLA